MKNYSKFLRLPTYINEVEMYIVLLLPDNTLIYYKW